MRLLDPATKTLLIDAREAKGVRSRMRGLMGADQVGAGKGLALRARHIHTFGMKIAIDALYLSVDGSVLRIATLSPRSIGPLVLRARWIVETGAGEAKRLGIVTGSKLQIEAE